MNLDFNPEQLRQALYRTADLVVDLYRDLDERPVFAGHTPAEVSALFDEPVPEAGLDFAELLDTVARDVVGNATLHISPRFLAYVSSTGTHAGIAAEMLVAALNQNCSKWHAAPSAIEMELRVIRWLAEFIGYPEDTGGVLVSGGSMANLTCLAVARKARAPFDIANAGAGGGPRLTVYASTETHAFLEKSMDLMGLGKDQARKIRVGDDFRVDVEAMREQIAADRSAGYFPICIVGNGGTVNTGAVDPLDALADLAAEQDLWFHVDAAYGGPAAGTELAGHLFKGLERADSVALDPHKWLFAPFEVGCALVRDRNLLRDTYSLLPAYLRTDVDKTERTNMIEYNWQLTRAFNALKVWMNFKLYGADMLRAAIEDNIRLMRRLGELIEAADDFELLAPIPLSAVCFRYLGTQPERRTDERYLAALNERLLEASEADGRYFITATHLGDRTVMRACCVNHRTDVKDIEGLLPVLRELGGVVK
jgi:aromatic-L-amino-acid/L-tryptophan decarboxylase